VSSVFDSLQQVRRIDPAAEQQLIDQLRASPPDSWPLVAEQFRASLAYREQLRSQHQGRPDPAHAASAPWRQQQRPRVDIQSAASSALPIDPHNANVDGLLNTASAHSTPFPAPAVTATSGYAIPPIGAHSPAPLAGDRSDYPLAMPHAESTASPTFDSTDGIVQSSFSGPVPDTSLDRDWRQFVQAAATELRHTAPRSPASTAEVHQLATLRILDLLSGSTEQAIEAIPNLSPTEQDYWSNQLFALATYLDHHAQPDGKRRAAASVIYLDNAVWSLRELGTLSLRNLTFCKEVYGYGALQPYDADRFSPGEQVSLYVEVENYHSRSTEKGYCTSLGSTYEILTDSGERVASGKMPDVDDCCRSRRRDFHIQYGITLPKTLLPGQYRFNLVVKDRQGDKIGSATAAFEIIGNAS
jgi:hypothetical protein